jgi:hypothetical protein
VCDQSFSAEKEKLQNVEAKIVAKRAEYKEVCGQSLRTFIFYQVDSLHTSKGDISQTHALICRFLQSSLK